MLLPVAFCWIEAELIIHFYHVVKRWYLAKFPKTQIPKFSWIYIWVYNHPKHCKSLVFASLYSVGCSVYSSCTLFSFVGLFFFFSFLEFRGTVFLICALLFFCSPTFSFSFFLFSYVFTELGNIPTGKWNHIRLFSVNAWFLPFALYKLTKHNMNRCMRCNAIRLFTPSVCWPLPSPHLKTPPPPSSPCATASML